VIPHFRFTEHTADIGLEVFARTREELFELAAFGMTAILTTPEKIHPLSKKTVNLRADHLDELLVVWLNRLNFEFETEGWLFSEFDVRLTGAFDLMATLRGELFNPERHEILREIKAATYHHLIVEKRKQFWYANVIFDL